jgi:hypothetical protein
VPKALTVLTRTEGDFVQTSDRFSANTRRFTEKSGGASLASGRCTVTEGRSSQKEGGLRLKEGDHSAQSEGLHAKCARSRSKSASCASAIVSYTRAVDDCIRNWMRTSPHWRSTHES